MLGFINIFDHLIYSDNIPFFGGAFTGDVSDSDDIARGRDLGFSDGFSGELLTSESKSSSELAVNNFHLFNE